MRQGSIWLRRRKFAITIALPIAAVLGLAACGAAATGNSSQGNGHITLTMALQSTESAQPAESALTNEYHKLHPDISFKITQIAVANYGQVIRTEFQGGNAPDIVYGTAGYGSPNSLPPLGDAGYLVPLNGTPAQQLLASTGQNGSYTGKRGKIYGQPEDYIPMVMLVNENAMRKAGLTVPKSLGELYSDCAKAVKAGKSLIAVPAGDDLIGMVLAASPVYHKTPNWTKLRAAGKVTFASSPGWTQVLETWVHMDKAGCFQKGAAAGTDTSEISHVASGQSIAMIDPAHVIYNLKQANSANTYITAPFPGVTPSQTDIMASSTDALAVNAHADKATQKAALRFLDWLAQPAQADKLAQAKGDLPITAIQGGKVNVPPEFALLKGVLSNPRDHQQFAELFWPNGNVANALLNGMTGLLTGQTTIHAVLKSMDAAW